MSESPADLVLSSEANRLKLQRQIEKDFAQLGGAFPVDFCERLYERIDLLDLIEANLVRILEQSERNTLQLMYLIDLPEAKFLALTQDPDFLKKITQLILDREIQKIYFRLKYS